MCAAHNHCALERKLGVGGHKRDSVNECVCVVCKAEVRVVSDTIVLFEGGGSNVCVY